MYEKKKRISFISPLNIVIYPDINHSFRPDCYPCGGDLNTELPGQMTPRKFLSEIPTETPVVPSTENPKPVLQGLIHDKNGHFYFYQNGKKLKNRWKKVGKNKYYFGKNGQAVTGKKNIFPITYVTLIKKGF
ncbi:MAG: hypothetical protein ACLRIT_10320 [Blautia sp.]